MDSLNSQFSKDTQKLFADFIAAPNIDAEFQIIGDSKILTVLLKILSQSYDRKVLLKAIAKFSSAEIFAEPFQAMGVEIIDTFKCLKRICFEVEPISADRMTIELVRLVKKSLDHLSEIIHDFLSPIKQCICEDNELIPKPKYEFSVKNLTQSLSLQDCASITVSKLFVAYKKILESKDVDKEFFTDFPTRCKLDTSRSIPLRFRDQLAVAEVIKILDDHGIKSVQKRAKNISKIVEVIEIDYQKLKFMIQILPNIAEVQEELRNYRELVVNAIIVLIHNLFACRLKRKTTISSLHLADYQIENLISLLQQYYGPGKFDQPWKKTFQMSYTVKNYTFEIV